jgi:alanine dehydrogenase
LEEDLDPRDTIIPNDEGLLLLSARDIAAVLTPRACREALSEAYAALHADPGAAPQSIGFRVEGGGFHLKAGLMPGARDVLVAKLNGNFPGNRARGLPTVQGIVLLTDATDGRPLAIMDSGELTAWRTAAATALAARHGARPDSRTATIVGCGRQAGHQLAALADLLLLEQAFAVDIDPARGRAFARAHSAALDLEAYPADDLAEAARRSDVIVLCTTAAEPVLMAGMVPPGAFVAAVGADNPGKQELAPEAWRGAAILVDDLEQCADHGELSHAIAAGVVAADGVRASLAELAAGAVVGRRTAEEVVIYDSVGVAVQDVAVARLAWRAAVERRLGLSAALT